MKIKLKNAHIFTVNETFQQFEKGCLTVKDDKITYVGKDDRNIEDYDRVIDCHGDILMPGFVNAHAHSGMTLFRGLADGLPLDRWLFDRIFPLEAKLTPEDVYYGTLLAILEYVKAGITFVGDAYFFPEAMYKAYDLTGLRGKYVCMPNDISSEPEKTLETLKQNFASYHNKTDLFSLILGVHAQYTCSDKFLTGVADFAIVNKQPLYTHISETLKEVGDCTVSHGGLTPPQLLHKIGFFENGGTVAHGVHLDKEDIALLSQSNVSIVHNPSSNLKLASGIAPVFAMLSQGINVALGTDGAASNNSLDMFKEMYLMSVLQKASMYDATAVTVEQTLRAATVNGARALFSEKVGILKEGYQADIIRISTKSAHFKPHNEYINHLAYSAKSSDVVMTMVAGKILYESGKYNIGIDEKTVYKECEKIIKRLTH